VTTIKIFEDLECWQTSRELTRDIYDVSGRGKFERDFALRDQIRRAAISVMSNIAEGFESRTTKLFIDHLGRAKASAGEVRSQLYIAVDGQHIGDDEFARLKSIASRASRQISGLISYLKELGPDFSVRENLDELEPYE
jgi:four helix bundle protein